MNSNSAVNINNESKCLYKANKYHYKIQKKLLQMKQAAGASWVCPAGYEKYLSQSGGSSLAEKSSNDAKFLHKAKKYHHKIQQKLLQMKQAVGTSWICPTGYEQFLEAFKV